MNYDIVAINFAGSNPVYDRLEKGFVNSVETNTKGKLHIYRPPAPEQRTGCKYSYTVTHEKLRHWNEIVQNIVNPTILMDIDLIVRMEIADVFKNNRHITFTTNSDHRTWINSGVVFVKPTQKARKFFEQWYKMDSELYNSAAENGVPGLLRYEHWRTGCMGMNQTSLATMVEGGDYNYYGVVPSTSYNCWYGDWQSWNPDTTTVVHVQMGLREQLLNALDGRLVDIDRKERRINSEIISDIIKYYR